MSYVNLVEFYSVQLCSGHEHQIFLSFYDAQKAADRWDKKQEERFNAGCTDIMCSSIDMDGVKQFINPVFLSGNIHSYPLGTESLEKWSNSSGFEKVKWGRLATQRAKKSEPASNQGAIA